RNDCVTTLEMGIDSYGPHVGSTQAAMSLQFLKKSCFDRPLQQENRTVFNEPLQGEAVSLQWRCEDTRNIPHKKKRWLTGDPRKEVSTKLLHGSAHVFRCELANKIVDKKDLESPNLLTEEC
ncbi:hypothetical protein J6590_106059, partial [Homalodisca vitripennis]